MIIAMMPGWFVNVSNEMHTHMTCYCNPYLHQLAVDDPTGPDPLTIGIYVIIPFAVLVALLLIVIGALLFLSLTHNR